jgi:uncharacterized membrane protein YgaE (UPF0421/DUF939 family)
VVPRRLTHRLPALLARRGRVPGLQTAKTTLAAVLSFLVAEWLRTSEQPVLAPLTALLVVQLTTYRTVAQGLERVVSVVAGVLVAVAVAAIVGLSWWSLGAVVALSLIVGQLLRLGPQLLEVPISAMLVLAVGGAENAAAGRVYETVIGAVIGVAVNLVVVPPLYLQPAGEALGELAGRMERFLRDMARELLAGWSRAAADRWLNEARALTTDVSRVEEMLTRAEESARLNPRGAVVREAQPRLRTALTAFEHCYVSLRNLCRALLDRTYFVPLEEQATVFALDVRTALAELLEAAGDAIHGVLRVVSAGEPAEEDQVRLEGQLVELRRRRDRLSRLLIVEAAADQATWQQHGALLAAVDRLRVEVEAAARRPETAWRPPRLRDRQRHAVRRVLDARTRHLRGRRRDKRS